MSLRDRQAMHVRVAEAALASAEENGSPGEMLHRIEAAIHEVGATFALANRTDTERAAEVEEREACLRLLDEAIERHQEAIRKAHEGRSPWGEILLAGEDLKQAVGRVRAL